jgi:hypothetical protein
MMGVIILIFRVLLMRTMGTAVGRCPASFGRRHTRTVWGQSGVYHVLAVVWRPGAHFELVKMRKLPAHVIYFNVLCRPTGPHIVSTARWSMESKLFKIFQESQCRDSLLFLVKRVVVMC